MNIIWIVASIILAVLFVVSLFMLCVNIADLSAQMTDALPTHESYEDTGLSRAELSRISRMLMKEERKQKKLDRNKRCYQW